MWKPWNVWKCVGIVRDLFQCLLELNSPAHMTLHFPVRIAAIEYLRVNSSWLMGITFVARSARN